MAIRVLTLCALLAWAGPAEAQNVNLQFANGRVSLRAQNAPVRVILAEWARLGGATIVNGERVPGGPLTLELTDVSERQALDIVLRGVAGYMLGPRRAGTPGASEFDRIMILPTSVAPRTPAPATTATQPRPAMPRAMIRPQPQPVEEPEPGLITDDDVAAQPVMPAPFPPGPQPFGRGQVPPEQQETEAADDQSGLTVVGSQTNPFGIPAGSSATPGVIAPVPARQQPQQNAPPNRVQ